MAKALDLDMRKDVMSKFTFTVHVKMGWRVRAGLWLMRMGARLCGCKVVYEEPNDALPAARPALPSQYL